MNHSFPVFTAETECQDCYKCVRQCPVKGIRIEAGHASVVPQMCVACGHCVKVCPAKAKHVRDDLGRARMLLANGRECYASLAPSFISEFPNISPGRLVAAINKLGFKGVSETALGAQEVSSRLAAELSRAGGLRISSACPAAVEFIRKYLPAQAEAITPLLSPMLAHGKLLRAHFGQDIGVVFFGPCAAKKREADSHPDIVNLALTFADLRRWLAEERLSLESPAPEAPFVPDTAKDGALYPVEGGMAKTVQTRALAGNIRYVTLTGLQEIENTLSGVVPASITQPVFIECLACRGGCVMGPCASSAQPGLQGILQVLARGDTESPPPAAVLHLDDALPRPEPLPAPSSPSEMKAALARVGKTSPADELNCGGCGYDTCRHFARALIAGNAEPAMCVSYMRRIAQRKANALLRCLPVGVVIVDANLKIIECNKAFAHMFGEDARVAFETLPGLAGAELSRMLDFPDLFRTALRSGQEIYREHWPSDGRLLDIVIFPIEPKQTLGAIIQDVTKTETRREQIAHRAREVISKNLATVQEIACRLGEHMAETEILLNAIAEDYSDEPDAAAAQPAARQAKDFKPW